MYLPTERGGLWIYQFIIFSLIIFRNFHTGSSRESASKYAAAVYIKSTDKLFTVLSNQNSIKFSESFNHVGSVFLEYARCDKKNQNAVVGALR